MYENINALDEMGNNCKDAGEFISPSSYGRNRLWARCFKLSKGERVQDEMAIDGKTVNTPIKDAALLNFAKIMGQYEREWRTWYVRMGLKGRQYPLGWEKVETTNGNQFTLRRDEDSPYFRNCSTTDSEINMTHMVENQLYHDELKFLITQLHKMDLYWAIKPNEEKTSEQLTEFNKTRNLLAHEIEAFKDQKNRMAFTHSCVQVKDFEDIQKGRHAYEENLWNNRSLVSKIWNYGERKRFKQDVSNYDDVMKIHKQQLEKKLEKKIKQQNAHKINEFLSRE